VFTDANSYCECNANRGCYGQSLSDTNSHSHSYGHNHAQRYADR
jgi:hypothetical protein